MRTRWDKFVDRFLFKACRFFGDWLAKRKGTPLQMAFGKPQPSEWDELRRENQELLMHSYSPILTGQTTPTPWPGQTFPTTPFLKEHP